LSDTDDGNLFELRAWAPCVLPGDPLYSVASEVLKLLTERDCLAAEAVGLRAAFAPPGAYRCGCPAVWSDKIKAFCPTHLMTLADDPPARTDPCPPPPTE
jgi:hypothetical protein